LRLNVFAIHFQHHHLYEADALGQAALQTAKTAKQTALQPVDQLMRMRLFVVNPVSLE
jgi:hypothetical protein